MVVLSIQIIFVTINYLNFMWCANQGNLSFQRFYLAFGSKKHGHGKKHVVSMSDMDTSGTWLHACPGKIKKKKFISQTRWQCRWGTTTIFFLKKILIIRHNQCCWLILNQIRSSLLNSIDLLSWLIIKSALILAADWIWSICWSVGWSLSHTHVRVRRTTTAQSSSQFQIFVFY